MNAGQTPTSKRAAVTLAVQRSTRMCRHGPTFHHMDYRVVAGLRSANKRMAINSAVQGAGADKLKTAMILLHHHLQEQLHCPCRLMHTVRCSTCMPCIV